MGTCALAYIIPTAGTGRLFVIEFSPSVYFVRIFLVSGMDTHLSFVRNSIMGLHFFFHTFVYPCSYVDQIWYWG